MSEKKGLSHPNRKYLVKLVSASFADHSGVGIIEYGVRLLNALKSEKSEFEICEKAAVKGNVFNMPKHLYKEKPPNPRANDKPDLTHYLDPGFIVFDALFSRQNLRRTTYVVTMHDLDVFKIINLKAMIKEYNAPHNLLRKPLMFISTPFITFTRMVTTSFVMKYAKAIICVSEKTQDEVVKRYKVSREHCPIVYPIIASSFKPLRVKKDAKKTIVGHISSYLPNKNVRMLINAFKKTKNENLELRLYGGQLPYKISDDKRIKYMGFPATGDLLKIFNSFDVFAFPSLWEGFGMPIMEAKKCKVPVITYAKGNITEIVKRNTLQFKDENDLARILDNKAWKTVNLEKAANDAKKCDEKYVAERTLDVYRKVLGENSLHSNR